MRFLALALLPAALAATVPSATPADPNETRKEAICIDELTIKKSASGGIDSISFLLAGDDATDLACEAVSPEFPTEVITCGESKYRFALLEGRDTEFSVRLYHELGTAFGFYGHGDLFTCCKKEEDGSSTCAGKYPMTIMIDGNPGEEYVTHRGCLRE